MMKLAGGSFATLLKNGSGQAGVGIFDRLARLAPLRAGRAQFRNEEIGTLKLDHRDAPRVSYAERYSGFLAAGFLGAGLGFQKSGAAAATSCGGLLNSGANRLMVNSTVRMDSETVLRNFS